MKINKILALLITLVLVLNFYTVLPVFADTISERANEILTDHIEHSYPNPDDSNLDLNFQGKVAYAYSAYATNSHIDTANEYVLFLNSNGFCPNDNTYEFDGYFSIPLFVSMYTDSTMRNRVSVEARYAARQIIWRFINNRSRVASAGAGNALKHWYTENHGMICNSSYFLGAKILKDSGSPYGPTATLADGKTLQEHHDAWDAYFKEYFKVRALNGINLEIASPSYEKYTLAGIYNIRDLAESATTRGLAEKYLNLYWADVAHDFLKNTGVRGSSGTRMYDNTYTTRGDTYSLRPWTYMYNWHETKGSTKHHPMILVPATSSYRIPDIITAIAKSTKGNFEYSSRRYGRIANSSSTQLVLPSCVRRDISGNADYVMGSLTYDTTLSFDKSHSESRYMGVFSNSSVNDRIIVRGKGTAKSGTAGYWELNGACYKDVLVVTRDKNATDNDGTRIFIGGRFSTNLIEDSSGWIFTRAGNSYAAIKLAKGSYTFTTESTGRYLELEDMWAPILIQMGRASSYSSFDSFKAAVLANTLSYSGGKLSYSSLRGDSFEIWRNTYNLPTINGSARSQNPTYSYKSPYLNGTYGNNFVTVSYPGYADLVIDFSY